MYNFTLQCTSDQNCLAKQTIAKYKNKWLYMYSAEFRKVTEIKEGWTPIYACLPEKTLILDLLVVHFQTNTDHKRYLLAGGWGKFQCHKPSTEDFSSVDTIIQFRNHALHIIVYNFIWRVWLRNGIIVSTEPKSSVLARYDFIASNHTPHFVTYKLEKWF